MKHSTFDLSKHMPRHITMKIMAVLLASVGLIGLFGSLSNTRADLVIQSSLNNAIQTIKEVHITSDGSASNVDRVRLDGNGVYIQPILLGGASEGILKLNNNGYIIRDLVGTNDIANDAITSIHIAGGSIVTGHLGFPYPATTNNSINIACPTGQVMQGVINGLPTCVPVATSTISNSDCGTTGFVQGWTNTGLVICNYGSSLSSQPGAGLWRLSATNPSDIYYTSGNVGVGLNNPLTMLHVNGSFKVDTPTNTFIVSGARVGINTVAPTANLDVSGTVRFSTYGGNGNRALGVDAGGFIVPTSGALWMQSGTATYTLVGNVGIGTHTPSEKLHVIGNVRANAFPQNSDSRLKKEIRPLSHMLEKIVRLTPVSFIWKTDNTNDIGLIAQDIEKEFPELVSTDSDGFKSVKYSNLIAPVIGAIQELASSTEEINNRYKANESRISSLENQIREIEKKLGVR